MNEILTLETKKYNIKLENFEGPLDLLCHLIDKNKMEIDKVNITQITEQYIEYLSTMEKLNLEIASEFIVMLSTLVYLKSKHLLPKEGDNEEEITEEELIRRIIEYKKEDIIESYKFLIEKNENKKNKNAINIEKIAIIETVTIASKVKDIFKELVKKQKFIFSKLCASKKYTKLETVTAFSGVLELSKRNKIITNQEKNFGDIIVEKK